ncbi:MAG: RraA family protein [Spirochaetales bacterium]|nr:MAG: RraA family protein [Spirochaetales bacterium]
MAKPDPYEIAERFRHYLRVTDVTDGLDAVGLSDLTLVSQSVRPLWMGMRFWGPAVTMRIVPANKRMPFPLKKEDALRQHPIWREMGGFRGDLKPHIKEGCVIVTSTGGTKECGWWGSMNSMEMQAMGAHGIVTDGNCRDTDEVIAQQTPVACASIGRPIIPGRLESEEVQKTVSLGGVQVRPGDIVGCDWDGVVVVPIEVAEDVLVFAARIAVDDKRSRRKLYDRLGKAPDETVDWEGAAEYFKDLL